MYKQAVAAVYISCVPQSIQRHCWELSQWPSGQDSTLSLLWPGVQSLAGEQDPEAIKYSQKKKKHFDMEITHLLSAKKQHLKAQHLERGDRVTDQGGQVSEPVLQG